MKKRIKLLSMSLFLALILVCTGCRNSQTETLEKSMADKQVKETLEAAEERNTFSAEEDDYIDEAYVDAMFGDEEDEDFSKYASGSAGNSSGKNSQGSTSSDDKEPSQVTTTYTTYPDGGYAPSESQDEYYTDTVPEGMPDPVEPQDTTVNRNQSQTCTLYVECSTLLNNMGNLTAGKESLVPSDGVIYGPSTVTFYTGESVYDVLLRELQNSRIHSDAAFTAIYNSSYIKAINNLYERDCGTLSGWMYSVNGWFPNYGCSRYQLQNGDSIEWHYTCDLGRDLGTDVTGNN